jgi:hypothetical protein
MVLCALIPTATSEGPPAGRPTERPAGAGAGSLRACHALAEPFKRPPTRGCHPHRGGDRRRCGRDARSRLAGVGHEPASACPGWMGSASGRRNPGSSRTRPYRRPVYPEVGDPLVDDLPPSHPGQPEVFMEVSFGGDRAWKLSSDAIRSSRTSRSCRFFDDSLARTMRRPPRVASAFLTPSPRLDELLGWLLIRLDWTRWRVNGWERDPR